MGLLPDLSSHSIGKHLLKLNSGDTVTGVFRGKTDVYYQHWKNNRSIRCENRATCALCASPVEGDRKAAFRFRINFLVETKDGWTAKVFEGGRRIFERLSELDKDVQLDRVKIQLVRSGTGKDTVYMALPVTGGMVDDKLNKVLLGVALIDLGIADKDEGEPDEAA